MNILWLHDNINDHQGIDKELKDFEKPIMNFLDGQTLISSFTNSEQQKHSQPSILIILNRIARQIVPEIHSFTTLRSVVIFCTKNDNKIKWAGKFNKVIFSLSFTQGISTLYVPLCYIQKIILYFKKGLIVESLCSLDT
jgi:hypothetical protein